MKRQLLIATSFIVMGNDALEAQSCTPPWSSTQAFRADYLVVYPNAAMNNASPWSTQLAADQWRGCTNS